MEQIARSIRLVLIGGPMWFSIAACRRICRDWGRQVDRTVHFLVAEALYVSDLGHEIVPADGGC
ncbi:hypothetical protein [Agrobacterium leguminum]|uniref:hypothetical protein n=1 Tax=Agrobacterium leguminum TaxID=2792015 RepID=UPI003CE48D78